MVSPATKRLSAALAAAAAIFFLSIPPAGAGDSGSHHDWHGGLHHDWHGGFHWSPDWGWHGGRHHGWHRGPHHDWHDRSGHFASPFWGFGHWDHPFHDFGFGRFGPRFRGTTIIIVDPFFCAPCWLGFGVEGRFFSHLHDAHGIPFDMIPRVIVRDHSRTFFFWW